MLLPRALSRRSALGLTIEGGLTAALFANGLGRAAAQDATPEDAIPFLPEIVLDWFGAWEAEDPPRAVAALYAADGGYYDVPSLTSAHGPDIEGFVRTRLAGLDQARRHMRGSFGAGRWAAVEQLFTATNQGFVPAAGTGNSFQVYAVTIFELDGDQIKATSDYYDFATILNELGVITVP